MKSFSRLQILLGIVLIGAMVGCGNKSRPIRLGWQTSWANQGQIVEVLKQSDLLSKNGVQVEFKPFTYGGPMGEAALAGDLDLLFAADHPAFSLMARDSNWKIIARLTNFRLAILVPPGSTIKSGSDLSEKTLAVPFGSTTQRETLRFLHAHGLYEGKNIRVVNLDAAEQAGLIARGGSKAWGNIDAMATWDPLVASSLLNKQAKILYQWIEMGVIVASNQLLQNHSVELEKFLEAYTKSYIIYAQHPQEFDSLYLQESRFALPPRTCQALTQFEPNMHVKSLASVDILFSSDRQKWLQQDAESSYQLGLIKKPIDLSKQTDFSLAQKAQAAVRNHQ